VAFIWRRLLVSIPVLLGVSFLTFMVVRLLPGDPVAFMLQQSAASADVIAQLRHDLELDKPLLVQYVDFMGRLLHGDLGRSIRSNRPVLEAIWLEAPSTIELAVSALTLSAIVGIALGVLAARFHDSWIDKLCLSVSLFCSSVPSFWLGTVLIFFFSLRLGWLPATGQGGLNRLILPALTLGAQAVGVIALLTRSSMRDVLGQEYVQMARGKGLSERRVMVHHALKNALIPVMTIIGLQFGNLLGGAVIVENVFSRTGVGRLAVDGITARDYPIVQGVVLVSAVVYVLVNIATDISYSLLDPRIRRE
jgi:ABC-type dipeptide/oligopeptide/nickel transport system permease component